MQEELRYSSEKIEQLYPIRLTIIVTSSMKSANMALIKAEKGSAVASITSNICEGEVSYKEKGS